MKLSAAEATDQVEQSVNPESVNAGTHIAGLDGVRGAAILMVLAFHTSSIFFDNAISWVEGGYLGVDLFFVLSGFLITSLLHKDQLQAGKLKLKRFYSRRFVRIVPALTVFLVFQYAYVQLAGLSKHIENQTLLSFVTLTNNYIYYFDESLNWVFNADYRALASLHLWTISLEVQFYLIAPLIVGTVCAIKRPKWTSIGSAIGLIVSLAVWRIALLNQLGDASQIQIYTQTDTRLDTFFFGMLLALLWHYFKFPQKLTAILGWIGLLALFVLVTMNVVAIDDGGLLFMAKGGYSLVALASTFIMAAVLTNTGPARLFALKSLRALGTVSYGLYLWHFLVFHAVANWCGSWRLSAQLVLAFGVTALATLASWYFIERPLLTRRGSRPDLR